MADVAPAEAAPGRHQGPSQHPLTAPLGGSSTSAEEGGLVKAAWLPNGLSLRSPAIYQLSLTHVLPVAAGDFMSAEAKSALGQVVAGTVLHLSRVSLCSS
jgi:hypothetical protein